MNDTLLVTGTAGFIGSAFARLWLSRPDSRLISLDALTYAGHLSTLLPVMNHPGHVFVQADIADQALVGRLLAEHRPRAVLNFAAESHVDRSISGPGAFIETNITGTFKLLEAVRAYRDGLPAADQTAFRYLQVSTDEVYGTLGADDPPFTEDTPYAPNSPYAASKAAADHLVRAWHETYGLPVLSTHCGNNYGPYQFPEKLIPLVTTQALAGGDLPIYGDGRQVRDWIYVDDHVRGIATVLERGRVGERYNIGGFGETFNLNVVHTICDTLDELQPRADGKSYREQIRFVKDRPGHDRRYAISPAKTQGELGWQPQESFASGIRKTIRWYLDSQDWTAKVKDATFREWLEAQYAHTASA
ncbi:MAG: dTDP-glucose 4,6-dehydratase [Burkholderiaceae bacterium]